MTTHEIIEAEEVPAGVRLKIQWREPVHVTTGFYSTQHAKALGWKRPDLQPVDPAWMVEVARESAEKEFRKIGLFDAAESARTGKSDDIPSVLAPQTALRLALSRGHVVFAPVMPSEEEMLKAAREDAAQVNDGHYPDTAASMRAGDADGNDEVKLALQARRNVYASLGAVAGKAVSSDPVVPEVDLREMANKAWDAGWRQCHSSHMALKQSASSWKPENVTGYRHDNVSAILENLKSGEA